MRPPLSVYFAALVNILPTTCSSCEGSAFLNQIGASGKVTLSV